MQLKLIVAVLLHGTLVLSLSAAEVSGNCNLGLDVGKLQKNVGRLTNPISKGDAADPFVTYDKVTGYYYGMCTESHAVVLRRARQISQLFDEGGLKKVIFRTNAVVKPRFVS